MSDIKLKPCPFCGGEAYINYETMTDEHKIYWAQVLCKKCHCRSAGNWSDRYASAERKEVKAWNTRKPMERIVAQLENEVNRWQESGKENEDEKELGVAVGFRYAIKIVKKEVDYD